MLQKIVEYGKGINLSFYLFTIAIMLIATATLFINNFSELKIDNIIEEAEKNSADCEKITRQVFEDFDLSVQFIQELLDGRGDISGDKKLQKLTGHEADTVLRSFAAHNDLVSKADFEWHFDNQIMPCSDILSYERSIYQNGNIIGVAKIQLDIKKFQKKVGVFLESDKNHYVLLLSPEPQQIIWEPDYKQLGIDEEEIKSTLEKIKRKQLDQKNLGYIIDNEVNQRYFYSFRKMDNGLLYIESQNVSAKERDANVLIILISIFAVITVLLIQENKRTNRTLFDLIADFIMKNYKGRLDPTKVKGQRAVIALHVGMAGAILADVIYSIALRKPPDTIIAYIISFLLVFSLIRLYMRSHTGLTSKVTKIVILLGLTLPVVMHILYGGIAAGYAGEGLLWLIVVIYISLFILGSRYSVKTFNLFAVILFIDLLIEIFFLDETNYEWIYNFFANFFFLGLTCFASMEIYVTGSRKDYRKMEKLLVELEENKNLLVQSEKMGTLGQLISGVAHEINTPIGAIKASAETMDVSFENFLSRLMENGRVWDDVGYDCFETIMFLTIQSKAEMKTTMEIRQKKKKLAAYFEEMELESKDSIVKLLVRLEIIDLDKIEENIKLFENDYIIEILEKAVELSSFLSGIPIIIYAADKVSQIVTALKSYVHTNSEGEPVEFNVAKNIENVLILYRNQLKHNIKVKTYYEEDLPYMKGNPDELSQVWTNLIQNAVYEMRDTGGTLEISVQKKETYLEIAFQDTGRGISENIKEKIFTPFFTTKKDGEGSGLGLSISKKVIEQRGGSIRVASGPGQGTRFVIEMPLL